MNLSFLAGAFASAYLNNPKFRASVDKSANQLIGYAIDTLNGKPKKGGASNAEQPEKPVITE